MLREAGLPLKIETLELEGPRDDEVLVRLAASGICHTDIDFCESGVSGPVVLGHEGAGVVGRVGRFVRGVKNRRPCRALLSVLRPMSPLQKMPPGGLRTIL